METEDVIERLQELAKAEREAAAGFFIVCGKPSCEKLDVEWSREDPAWFERYCNLLKLIEDLTK